MESITRKKNTETATKQAVLNKLTWLGTYTIVNIINDYVFDYRVVGFEKSYGICEQHG
jgi:hypothetical protein